MTAREREAWIVAIGEAKGGSYDYDTGIWTTKAPAE